MRPERLLKLQARDIKTFVASITFIICVLLSTSCNSDSGNVADGRRDREALQIGRIISKTRRSLVESIQDNVVRGETAAGHKHYQNEYRKIEMFFWYKIAGWMVEDAVERRSIHLKDEFQILDLGCGFGTLLSFSTIIYGAEGICLDQASTLFPNMSDIYDVRYVAGDIEGESLPKSGNFQVIIMTEVLEHFNFKPVPTLRKIYDVLPAGGSFFLSTPDAEGGWGRKHKYFKSLADAPPLDLTRKRIDDHIWHYNESELRAVVEAAGFKVKRLDRTQNRGFMHFNVWLVK